MSTVLLVVSLAIQAIPAQSVGSLIDYRTDELDKPFRMEWGSGTVLRAAGFKFQRSTSGSEAMADANIIAVNQVATATIPAVDPPPDDQNEDDIQLPEITTPEQLDYPEPIELPIEEPAYPQPQFQPTISNIRPFSTSPSDDSRPIESVGGNFDDLQVVDAETRQETSSTVFLWLGFIVAFMIFITSVYGSVVLFTRQRSSGERG